MLMTCQRFDQLQRGMGKKPEEAWDLAIFRELAIFLAIFLNYKIHRALSCPYQQSATTLVVYITPNLPRPQGRRLHRPRRIKLTLKV